MAEKRFIVTSTPTIDGYELYNHFYFDCIEYPSDNLGSIIKSDNAIDSIKELGIKYDYDAMVDFKIQDIVLPIGGVDMHLGTGEGSIHPDCYARVSGTFVNIRKKEK